MKVRIPNLGVVNFPPEMSLEEVQREAVRAYYQAKRRDYEVGGFEQSTSAGPQGRVSVNIPGVSPGRQEGFMDRLPAALASLAGKLPAAVEATAPFMIPAGIASPLMGQLAKAANPAIAGIKAAGKFFSGPEPKEVYAKIINLLADNPESLHSITDMRKALPGIPKAKFDEAMLQLAREGEVALHHHDYPASLAPDALDKLVKSMPSPQRAAEGQRLKAAGRSLDASEYLEPKYFVGAVLRNPENAKELLKKYLVPSLAGSAGMMMHRKDKQ